jgi:hypothetical protein
MVRTQIQLEEKQAARLREAARRRGVSQAELVRHAIDVLLASEAGPSEAQKRERALTAVGAGRSGLHDVSKRHDDYLAEDVLA